MSKKPKIHVNDEHKVFMHGVSPDGDEYYVSVQSPYQRGFINEVNVPFNEKDRQIQLRDVDFLIAAFTAQRRWLDESKTWHELHGEGE